MRKGLQIFAQNSLTVFFCTVKFPVLKFIKIEIIPKLMAEIEITNRTYHNKSLGAFHILNHGLRRYLPFCHGVLEVPDDFQLVKLLSVPIDRLT